MTKDFHPFNFPEIEELFGELLISLLDESGRGALLIATAHVDNHLSKLIESTLPRDISKSHKERLFKYPGHLSSFSSKIELAFVFRLIGKKVYDSLNALRKLRNDAAHSHLKIELHELNEKLKSIYELGPGFSDFIREVSMKAMLHQKVDSVKSALASVNLTQEKKQEVLEKIFSGSDHEAILKEQAPFWELVFGLTFICGLLVDQRERISKLTENIVTFSDLSFTQE